MHSVALDVLLVVLCLLLVLVVVVACRSRLPRCDVNIYGVRQNHTPNQNPAWMTATPHVRLTAPDGAVVAKSTRLPDMPRDTSVGTPA